MRIDIVLAPAANQNAAQTTWQVTVSHNVPNDNGYPKTHTIQIIRYSTKLAGRTRTVFLPIPPETTDIPAFETTLKADYDSIARGANLAVKDSNGKTAIQRLGGALFDAVLRPYADLLTTEGVGYIEIAFRFDMASSPLASLPFEAMHDGTTFLAQYDKPRIAITRRVLTTPGPGETLRLHISERPRILLVVGTDPTDMKVRPGAEYLGMLRCFRNSGFKGIVSINLLIQATPNLLFEAVKKYRPHIVHFICHGSYDRDNGYDVPILELRDDPGKNNGRMNAVMIREHLAANGTLPLAVVLNACYSASAGDPGDDEEDKSGEDEARTMSQPLAAALAAGGIPVVVGMAGEVRDRACRLFTTQFYSAMLPSPDDLPPTLRTQFGDLTMDAPISLYGKPLGLAVASGRRAGILVGGLSDPTTSRDWTYPTLFLRDDLAADVMQVDLPKWQILVEETSEKYRSDAITAFCGRTECFEQFDLLLADSVFQQIRVPDKAPFHCLAVRFQEERYTDNTDDSLIGEIGASRLLAEYAAKAARAGHVPILVNNGPRSSPTETIGTLEKAIAAIFNAVAETAEYFEVPCPWEWVPYLESLWVEVGQKGPKAELPRLLTPDPGEQAFPQDVNTIYRAKGAGALKGLIAYAICHNLMALRAAVVASRGGEDPKDPVSLVLLLDDVDRYELTTEWVIFSLLGERGIQKSEWKDKFRVVVSYMGGDQPLQGPDGTMSLDKATGRKDFIRLDLNRLPSPEIDPAIYSYLLLHWHQKRELFPVVINPTEKVKAMDFLSSVDEAIAGLPSRIEEDSLASIVKLSLKYKILISAGDEEAAKYLVY